MSSGKMVYFWAIIGYYLEKDKNMSYTPGDMSNLLGVPASTLRRWAIRFEKALSPQDMEAGRHRVYANSDLEVFRQIRDLAAKGHSLRSIENILTVIPPGQAKPEFMPNFEPEGEPTPPGDQSQNSALMIVTNMAGQVGTHNAQIQALQDQINKQNERLGALTEFMALPWYKRIGKRPPVKY